MSNSSTSHQSLKDRLALLISAVSSPFLVLTTFGLWVITVHTDLPSERGLWGSLYLLFEPLPPFLYVLYGIRTNRITDIHVMVREQRDVPFLVATASTFVLALICLVLAAPVAITAMVVAMGANGVVFYLLTHYSKVSIHAASYAASVLLVTYLIDGRWVLLQAFLPLIVWARLRRQRHSVGQALAATAVVLPVTYLVLYCFQLV